MLKIGIPRALVYYEHGEAWGELFKHLGHEVIYSRQTDKDILDLGVMHCSNETCLPVKAYHGHVLSLLDSVDYVFVPRYISMAQNELTCPKVCALPDLVKLNLKGRAKVIELRYDLNMGSKGLNSELKLLAKKLNISYDKVNMAYNKVFLNNQTGDEYSEGKPSIAVLGHPYMIYDSYLSMKLISKIEQKGYGIVTPDSLNKNIKREQASPYVGKVFWHVGIENLGSANIYFNRQSVKGIIYLTPFACGIDSVITGFIELKQKMQKNIPLLKLTIDEHTGEAGLDTRLEAFLDVIG